MHPAWKNNTGLQLTGSVPINDTFKRIQSLLIVSDLSLKQNTLLENFSYAFPIHLSHSWSNLCTSRLDVYATKVLL